MRDPWTTKCIPDLRIPMTTPEESLFKPTPHNPWSQRTIPPPPNALESSIHYNPDMKFSANLLLPHQMPAIRADQRAVLIRGEMAALGADMTAAYLSCRSESSNK